MGKVACAFGQAAVLVILALVVGLGVNAVRARNSINLTRDYFAKPPVIVQPSTTSATTEKPEPNAPAKMEGPTPDHPFQIVTVEDVIKLFQDPKTAEGAFIFVDARADNPFRAGHIPGAVQCDYYREKHLESVLPRLYGAEKIIVYCNGGDCEDSLHLCSELYTSQIPWGSIYLFKGGWEEWQKSGQRVETAPSPE